jgi:hypothetical protein
MVVGLACLQTPLDHEPSDPGLTQGLTQNAPPTGGNTALAGAGGVTSSTGNGGAGDTTPPVATASIEQELMARWNQAASTVPNNMCCGFSFAWDAFDEFPHPTFKLGTEVAYQEFAQILLIFFQAGDNFDFLARNSLFRLPLPDVGVNQEVTWTFEQLANSFASSTAYGNIPEATRAALAAYAVRIQQAL